MNYDPGKTSGGMAIGCDIVVSNPKAVAAVSLSLGDVTTSYVLRHHFIGAEDPIHDAAEDIGRMNGSNVDGRRNR